MNKQSAAAQEIEIWMNIKAKTGDAQKGKKNGPYLYWGNRQDNEKQGNVKWKKQIKIMKLTETS